VATSNGFLGRFEYQMDDKGRVSLPSAFRRGEEEADRFVLIQWEKPYLTLFPSEMWSDVQQRMVEYRKSGDEAMQQVREMAENAAHVAPDKQGRILIPPVLQQAASLKGAVLVIGNLDRIEIWNPEDYRSRSAKTPTAAQQAFARQVFG
jgi:MraZ protein